MGHAVIALGQHKLNTTTIIETTASDLSQALNTTILYGYIDDWIDTKTGKDGSF